MKNKPIIRTAVIMLTCLLSTVSFAQTTLKGKVLEDKSQTPIPYATVYINGTSNGTITDENGVFKLNGVYPSAELVVSHLSYEPMVLSITPFGDDRLTISLQAKQVSISQLDVDASDNRASNIKRFKNGFLGYDYWGKEAVLLNDSVLVFRKEYEVQEETKDDTIATKYPPRECLFEVSAQAPLLIDLPQLGYTLYVDLLFYRHTPGSISALGYYYYTPYPLASKRKKKKVEKNRQKAYYNSVQHFCRALFSDSLDQNGYTLLEPYYVKPEGLMLSNSKELDVDSGLPVLPKREEYFNGRAFLVGYCYDVKYNEVDIDSSLFRLSDSEMAMKNLNGRTFLIRYRYDVKGEPAARKTIFNAQSISSSYLFIEGDSCTFSKDGIIPGNGIVFGGAISRKRTGAALPKYYKVK